MLIKQTSYIDQYIQFCFNLDHFLTIFFIWRNKILPIKKIKEFKPRWEHWLDLSTYLNQKYHYQIKLKILWGYLIISQKCKMTPWLFQPTYLYDKLLMWVSIFQSYIKITHTPQSNTHKPRISPKNPISPNSRTL